MIKDSNNKIRIKPIKYNKEVQLLQQSDHPFPRGLKEVMNSADKH